MKTATFNGTLHTTFPGLRARSGKRSVKPAKNNRYLTIPGRDGTYMFPGDNQDRPIPIIFTLSAQTYEELWSAFEDIAAWLNTEEKAQLILDDKPDRYYMAIVEDEITPDFVLQSKPVMEFTVNFHCDPHAYLIDTAVDAATFDSDLTWESNLTWDDTFNFPVNAPTAVDINNFGTVEVAPVITVTGTFTTLTLTVNSKTFTYTEALATGTLSIDNGKWNVTLDGVNKNDKWSGSRVVLAPGGNQVQIGGTNLNCTVDFGALVPEFL